MVDKELAIRPNQREGFDLIWRRFPERQIKSSSVWWYVMLMPKQAEGYGPKQAMFSLNCMAGDTFTVNERRHPGFNRTPHMVGEDEHLNTVALGWYFDGQKTYKKLVHDSAPAVLSPNGSISGWKEGKDGRRYGGSFRAYGDKPFGMLGEFYGSGGGGVRFEAWGDPSSDTTSPGYVYDYDFKLAGFHVVSWRNMHFVGEITSPSGSEFVEGIGYFQRVIFDVPLFPWRWVFAAFADGSVFSCTIAYAGLHMLRRKDDVYRAPLEDAFLPINNAGFFHPKGADEAVHFTKAKVTRHSGDPYPAFSVECSNDEGDFMRFQAVPHSHLQYILTRPFFGGRWNSKFNYNEYPFRMAELEGVINGKMIDPQALGEGFGNCEYTWGLFL
ncbi:MAG: hypothetical protein ACK2UG_01635 [Candidatus Promineifilaceae bacterium]|jgi:hypothetical protein